MKKIIFILTITCLISFDINPTTISRQTNSLNIKEIPFTKYHLLLGCNTIQHHSGSTIIVPDNTFDCDKQIVIKYREFRDPYDMIIHNIPMHYNDGKRRQLESGGMFEIKAECNGIPIEPRQGKQIQVRYRCDKHIDGLETYKMNEDGRYWQKKPIEIMEMSFDPKNNSSTRPDLWGNDAIPRETQSVIDPETGEPITDADGETFFTSNSNSYFNGVFKGINIYEMGLYNYDAIINELGVIPIVGAAEIIDQADLNIESLYVIYDSLNTTYYYSPDDLKKRFVIRPDVKANIFAVLKNGFIASFSLARFNSVNWRSLRNKKYSFKLDLEPKKPTKKEDLKK
jgi:hypothetical protein